MRGTDSQRVLVVEDDRDNLANLQDLLEMKGFLVDAAGTAHEALARENWSDYSAILLDRKLPDGTAEEILPVLRKVAPRTAVIVITGYADTEGIIAALREGAADYILKPITPEILFASLDRIAKFRDIELRALQAERLAAIGEMMTILAHESRNAFQRSKSFLEELAEEIQDRPGALALLARAEQSQTEIQKLFEDLRGYAAPIVLNRKPCWLDEIVDEAWSQISQLRVGRQVHFRQNANGFELRATVDEFRLVQVFRNLFENALVACTDPVEIVVDWSQNSAGDSPHWRVAVQDNGPGLHDVQRARVFEPFYTTKSKGTGLGMAIAKRIVEAHGGEISLGSQEGAGAIFLIILPKS